MLALNVSFLDASMKNPKDPLALFESFQDKVDFALQINDQVEKTAIQAEKILQQLSAARGDIKTLERVVAQADKDISRLEKEYDRVIKRTRKAETKREKELAKKVRQRIKAQKKEIKKVTKVRKKEIKKLEKEIRKLPKKARKVIKRLPPERTIVPEKKPPAELAPVPKKKKIKKKRKKRKKKRVKKEEKIRRTKPGEMRRPPADIGGVQTKPVGESKIKKFLGGIPGIGKLFKQVKEESLEAEE